MNDVRRQVAELLCAAARLHGCSAQVTSEGDVRVTDPTGTTVFYLDNLISTLAAAPQHDWAALVADHLATALSHYAVDRAAPLRAMEFFQVQVLVRTRLYPDSFGELLECVSRPVAPGLTQHVVLDSVHTIAPVTPELSERWNVTEETLFTVAERNTHADEPLMVRRADFPAGAPPWFLLAGEDYTSAHALWLGDYREVIGRAGALFTIASEGTIRAAPIDGVDVLETGTNLAILAAHHFANDPRQISPHLYRWHNGRIELAAYVRSAPEGLGLYPTDEFLTLLNQLAG